MTGSSPQPETASLARKWLSGVRARWQALRPLIQHRRRCRLKKQRNPDHGNRLRPLTPQQLKQWRNYIATASIIARTLALTPQQLKQWRNYIATGMLIEVILLTLHFLSPEPLVKMENWALDCMMAIHAVIAREPPHGRRPPKQIFVNVDDASWRAKEWGGGEPYRAPREPMFKLIETAFDHGARQVVLDILVEGNNAVRLEEIQEDKKFAEGLKTLLANKNFGTDKQLVLVRSIRHPLPQVGLDKGNTPITLPYPALSELRESPLADEVAQISEGRIVVAAPYFVYSTDRVLRDWQLLKVVCQRKEQGSEGVLQGDLRVVPSVQLLVATRHLGVSADKMPKQADERCTPFPQQELAELPLMPELTLQQQVADEQEHKASIRYWEALRGAVLSATADGHSNKGVDLGKIPSDAHDLGNRVVFRSGANLKSDKYFDEISARLLLDDAVDVKRLESTFTGRVVVIGQSHAEAGDRHHTPMGQVTGSVVLLNAIDSMVRYPLIHAPSAWKTLAIAILLIVVVGYASAAFNSDTVARIYTALALPTWVFLSFYLFTYGVWLDFVLPGFAIALHHEFERWLERRQTARQCGASQHH